MTLEGVAVPTVAEIEQRVQEMARALSAGRRPSREDADRLRADVNLLMRTEKCLAPWRLAELHADVQEVVRHALPPAPPPIDVHVQRGAKSRTRRRAPSAAVVREVLPAPRRSVSIDLDVRFLALRERVDALHDAIAAGQRPSRAVFDSLHDELTVFRRQADGPEIRQMLDDVRLLHRVVLAEARRSNAGLSVTDGGRRSQSRFASTRRRRFGTSRTSRKAQQTASEEERLIEEAGRLRERADKFAAAKSAGRVLPLRESDRLFLHFRIVRPQVDVETRALNDAAVRRLTAAVVEARARQPH